MRSIAGHVRTYIFRGLLASIPFALSLFAIHFFYVSIDQRVLDLLYDYLGVRFPGLGIVLLLLVLCWTIEEALKLVISGGGVWLPSGHWNARCAKTVKAKTV